VNTLSKIIATLALTALPAVAQDTPPATPMAPPSPSANADLTGQRIYNTDGDWIGTVTRMGHDTQGQPLAAVAIERKLGIAGTTVLFPMGSLQPREKGGYMTNLTGDQIKQLPKSNATNTP
jgi:hypothetical protein